MNDLSNKKCVPCEGGIDPIEPERARKLLTQLNVDWQLGGNEDRLIRQFKFPDFHHTITFVNAVAWIAIQENHHPDLSVGYNHMTIEYTTHAIKGLSENDFICAAKIDKLVA